MRTLRFWKRKLRATAGPAAAATAASAVSFVEFVGTPANVPALGVVLFEPVRMDVHTLRCVFSFHPIRANRYGGRVMKRAAIVVCLFGVGLTSAVALAAGPKSFKKALDGYDEVPAVSTGARGLFKAKISKDETRIEWELGYSGLEGAVQQAHIHIGNRGVDGGISVFLCTNLGNGPAGIQPCPAPPATISGVIVAADVSPSIPATAAARSQGLNTGEIDELIRAMQGGVTYVDVHSTTWPGGEIRAQLGKRK